MRCETEFPDWAKSKRKEVNPMKYEKPQITHVDDAGKAIQVMSKEAPIADSQTSNHLPPSAGVYEAND
jgi:hypothetical protein